MQEPEKREPEYRIEISHAAGVFRLCMPDLGLTVSDTDLGRAYEALIAEKGKILARFVQAGADYPPASDARERKALTDFAKKALLAGAVLFVVLAGAGKIVGRGIVQSVDGLTAVADKIRIPVEGIQAVEAQMLLALDKLAGAADAGKQKGACAKGK